MSPFYPDAPPNPRRFMDAVEREYEQEITAANRRGDDDHALELSIGLTQYRRMFKIRPTEADLA